MAAVAVRSLFLVAGWGRFFAGDEPGYERLGDIWRLEGIYVGAWPPGIPWLIATAGDVFGHAAGMGVLRFLLVLTSGFICHCLMSLTRRLAGRGAERTAGWCYALYLPLVPSAHLVVSEQLQVAFVLPALLILWGLVQDRKGWRACWHASLAGALLGVAGLLRESVVLLLPGVALWMLQRAGMRRGVLVGGYVALGLVAVTLPWATRNLRVTGQASWFGHSAGGFVAAGWNGHHADFDVEDLRDRVGTLPMGGLRDALLRDPPMPWTAPRTGAHAVRSSENVQRGMKFALEEPGWMLRTRVLHQARAWSPLSDMVRYLRSGAYAGPLDRPTVRGTIGTLALLQSMLLLACACLGWERMSRARGARWLMAIALAAYVASTFVLSMTRYRVLLDTLLFIPAAVWWRSRGERRPSIRSTAGLGFLCLAWAIELPWILVSMEALWTDD
ncbi:hypothetical protein Poly30_32800 [Planctomycetes bacterium Poly30]|uniref:Uncharacterized protein n=2 Tax=Saltatorellus ferox TaxID=2528018 RepID=A0A518EUL8_9BACT|nr:hypothetical protein Poly30_32800 [Planctomycetes bacterium Poly30]